jgi:stage IV sporulation protein A
VDLSTGIVHCVITLHPELFYQILSQRSGIPIQDDGDLIRLLTELSSIRREYDKVSGALSAVRATGYGVVMPTAEEMGLQPPEIVKKGSSYGLKLKAEASSIHMIRVDVDTEISPMVGDEQQSKDLVAFLSAQSPEKLWQSNIFGKSVYELIQDGLTAKLIRLPEDVRGKFRGTLQRIVNEGAQGLICLIL